MTNTTGKKRSVWSVFPGLFKNMKCSLDTYISIHKKGNTVDMKGMDIHKDTPHVTTAKRKASAMLPSMQLALL